MGGILILELNEDTKSLLYFKRVAELEHLTKAAQELFISQSQLSRIISALEDQYGVKFFDRVGKGIKLNACGKEYYEYILELFRNNDLLRKNLVALNAKVQSKIVITSNASAYMPMFLKMLITSGHDLNFFHMSSKSHNCVRSLLQGNSDFSICCPMIDNINLITLHLCRERAIVLYPEGHWLENYRSVSLEQLKNEHFIGQDMGYASRDSQDIYFKAYGFQPNYIVETNDSSMIPQCVNAGIGIAIVPRSAYIKDYMFKYRHVELEDELYGDVGLSWKKDRELSEKDNIFINLVQQYFSSR